MTGSASSAHPLLGERVRSALPTPHFEVTLAATSPAFLGDHRVHGAVIVPATQYVEMALAAAAQTLAGHGPVGCPTSSSIARCS